VDRPYFNVFTEVPKYSDNPLPRSCLRVIVEDAHARCALQGRDVLNASLKYLNTPFRAPIRAERSPLRNETRHFGFRPPRIGKFDF